MIDAVTVDGMCVCVCAYFFSFFIEYTNLYIFSCLAFICTFTCCESYTMIHVLFADEFGKENEKKIQRKRAGEWVAIVMKCQSEMLYLKKKHKPFTQKWNANKNNTKQNKTKSNKENCSIVCVCVYGMCYERYLCKNNNRKKENCSEWNTREYYSL